MNPYTGQIVEVPPDEEESAKNLGFTVPVNRSLTAKEKVDHQIKLYSPCVCGSGKKFKFCCKK